MNKEIILLIIGTLLLAASSSAVTTIQEAVQESSSSSTVEPGNSSTPPPLQNPSKTPIPTLPPVPPYKELVHQFDYDQSTPLNIQVSRSVESAGVTVQDIQYTGANGKPVTAFLVIPSGKGPFAGVIYLHWGQGNKSEFRNEAITIASHGVVSLLVDSFWNRPGYSFSPEESEAVSIVIDLRRGVDLLQSRPDVDPNRIGYVGHSYGASRGGVLAGVEKRIKTFILMAGFAFPSKYDGTCSPALDGYHYISHAAPNSLFFQFVNIDQYITRDMADEYYSVASDLKQIKWYEDSHSFTSRSARDDRIDWLVKELRLVSQ